MTSIYRPETVGLKITEDAINASSTPDPKPYPSWLLNEDLCLWEPPVAYPTDGNQYTWDENTASWVESE